MPKVSIIVPVYKVEQYIRECLDSIKAQIFTDWECLLIDDGSPDDSGKICDEYAQSDARFKVFHVENGGVSRARNIGLDNMMGEWVMFVDSDDAIAANTLELCVNYAESENTDIVQFSFVRKKEDLGKDDGVQTDVLDLLEYAKSKKIQVCAAGSLLRTPIIQDNKIRFNTQLKLAEDQIFIYEYMNKCESLMRVSNCLYWYRANENSASRNQRTGDIKNSISALVKQRNKMGIWRPIIDKVLTLFIVDIINNKDEEQQLIAALVKHCDIKDSSMLTGTYKIFYLLCRVNVRLAISFIRIRYKY